MKRNPRKANGGGTIPAFHLDGGEMNLARIAVLIEARILPVGAGADREISRVYAGDRISDLIAQASPKTLLVTNLANAQLVRVAQLMECPGICIANGADPGPEVTAALSAGGTTVLVSGVGLFETCGRLFTHLGAREPGSGGTE
jgi:hypothetical protein